MAGRFWNPLWILWAAMLLAIVVALAVAILAAQGQWSSDGELRREVFKSALQVLVVAVVGNLLTLGVQTVLKEQDRLAAERVKQQELAAAALAREQAREAAQREVRRELLGRILQNYAEAKKIRRQLRAGRDVDELFDRLNDVQLAFETHKKEVRAVPLFVQGAVIAEGLDSMEKYLNGIVRECESLGDAQPKFPFEGFPRLTDFTGTYRSSEFREHFVHPCERVVVTIQAELVGAPLTPGAASKLPVTS